MCLLAQVVEVEDSCIGFAAVDARMLLEVLAHKGPIAHDPPRVRVQGLLAVQVPPRTEVRTEALPAPVLPSVPQTVEVRLGLDLLTPTALLDPIRHEQMFAWE